MMLHGGLAAQPTGLPLRATVQASYIGERRPSDTNILLNGGPYVLPSYLLLEAGLATTRFDLFGLERHEISFALTGKNLLGAERPRARLLGGGLPADAAHVLPAVQPGALAPPAAAACVRVAPGEPGGRRVRRPPSPLPAQRGARANGPGWGRPHRPGRPPVHAWPGARASCSIADGPVAAPAPRARPPPSSIPTAPGLRLPPRTASSDPDGPGSCPCPAHGLLF